LRTYGRMCGRTDRHFYRVYRTHLRRRPKTQLKTMAPKPPKPPLPFGDVHCAHPSNTPMPSVTPLTAPNCSSVGSRPIVTNGDFFAQLRQKVPIGYNGTPYIHLQTCLFLLSKLHLHVINPSLTIHVTHHPKQHPDLIIHFPQSTHRTDRPTDGLGDKPVRIPTYALL